MNIILVVFDSLRKDCLSAYGQPPWGEVSTPHLDEFAAGAAIFRNAFPESLPTLPARRALYTGMRTYPFDDGDISLKGDFDGAPGWGPIPESQATMAEVLSAAGFNTALVSDVYHMFKPSKNYWRGFDQWEFVRGQECDPFRSGPEPSQAEIDRWIPRELQDHMLGLKQGGFAAQILKNMYGRDHECDYHVAQVMQASVRWLEENRGRGPFFLTIESFDPHEPWFVPESYRGMYGECETEEMVVSPYIETSGFSPALVRRAQQNYSALVSLCDRWFGYLHDYLTASGLLDETVIIVTSDHGHSIGDGDYMGKRGYPSSPEVFEIPLLIRHPSCEPDDEQLSVFVQHHDITRQILSFADVDAADRIQGRPFWENTGDSPSLRGEHATIGWGSAATVVTEEWWMNCKVDGTGRLLHRRSSWGTSVDLESAECTETAERMFSHAIEDAGGRFPDYLVRLAIEEADAPGCSPLARRTRQGVHE